MGIPKKLLSTAAVATEWSLGRRLCRRRRGRRRPGRPRLFRGCRQTGIAEDFCGLGIEVEIHDAGRARGFFTFRGKDSIPYFTGTFHITTTFTEPDGTTVTVVSNNVDKDQRIEVDGDILTIAGLAAGGATMTGPEGRLAPRHDPLPVRRRLERHAAGPGGRLLDRGPRADPGRAPGSTSSRTSAPATRGHGPGLRRPVRARTGPGRRAADAAELGSEPPAGITLRTSLLGAISPLRPGGRRPRAPIDRNSSTPAPAAHAWRAGPYAPSRRDRRLLASAHDSEATAVPVRVSLLRRATPGRRAALWSGRQDLPAVREAHRHPVRERAGGLPRVRSSAAVVEVSVAPATTLGRRGRLTAGCDFATGPAWKPERRGAPRGTQLIGRWFGGLISCGGCVLAWVMHVAVETRHTSIRQSSSREGPSVASPDRSNALDHVVVVMFENRSFDNLLGRLYEPGEVASFEGVVGKELSQPDPGVGRARRGPGGAATASRTT